jgi:hypothetical protein
MEEEKRKIVRVRGSYPSLKQVSKFGNILLLLFSYMVLIFFNTLVTYLPIKTPWGGGGGR